MPDDIMLTIEKREESAVLSAFCASPEFKGECPLAFTDDGKHLRVLIPAGAFSGYLMVIPKTASLRK